VSVDLIYGAPGESLDDWRRSVEAAVALAPDHISAYALIIEEGTKLERQIRRGDVAAPDDDLQADMYELADEAFASSGFGWYEVSNWATAPVTAPATTSRTGAAPTGGAMGRGAQPRRRTAVVERQAPRGVRSASPPARRPRRRASARMPPRGDSRTSPAVADRRGHRGVRADRRGSSRDRRAHRRRAHRRIVRRARRVVLTRRGRLLADAVVRPHRLSVRSR
jgi:oxygen-independent coproporphyrinogen-3 oxidase